MKKKNQFTIGLGLLAIGVVLLGVDRLFVSADNAGSYDASMTVVTIISLFFFLIGAIYLFKITFE